MKLNSVVSLLAALILGTFVTVPQGLAQDEKTIMKAAGCKTEFFLLKDLAEAYRVKTGTKMQLGDTGNKKAVDLLLEQKIDFTFTCKPIEKLTKGLNLDPNAVSSWTSVAVAKDPIIVVSNVQNGVRNLTTEQLTKLFQGEFSNWRELGGADLPIETAYLASTLESGIVLLFKEFTVGENGKLDEKAMIANGPSMLGNYVSVTPGAVTFMGLNSYQEKYGTILEIDGVAPTRENILSGSYGLAATYYLTLSGKDNQAVADFVDFVRSGEGQKAIDQNFISVSQ